MKLQQLVAFLAVILISGCMAQLAPNAPGSDTQTSEARETDARGTETRETDSETAAENSVVVLRLDQVATHADLRLRLLEINDSRCPQGVQCVWEGQVVATVEVSRENLPPEDSEKVELVLRAGQEPSAVMAAGRELRLLKVEPFPKEGSTPSRGDQVATVEVQNL